MANPDFEREVDPYSAKLSPHKVVEIHKAHRSGEAWDSITKRFRTNRKNVSRIVNGDRWPELHPSRRPDLYMEHTVVPASSEILRALDHIEEQIAAIRSALAQGRTAGR